MIDSAIITRFKGIAFQDIGFEPLTVIVGANGTGKTSVLEAVYLAIQACADNSAVAFKGELAIDQIVRHGDSNASVHLDNGSETLGFEALQVVPLVSPERSPEAGVERFIHVVPDDPKERRQLVSELIPAMLLRFEPRQLAKPSYQDQAEPVIDTNGAGLASALAAIKLSDTVRFARIEESLKSFVPGFRAIRILKTPIVRQETEFYEVDGKSYSRQAERTYSGESLRFDFDSGSNIAASGVSNGTLFLLGLLTVLYGPAEVKVLLIDDLGDGLHPTAQRNLMKTLTELTQRGDLQIIATTHSPFVLDVLDPEQVCLATLDKDGASVFGSLTEHPEFEKWKDEMAPGEMWSMFGEQWVREKAGKS